MIPLTVGSLFSGIGGYVTENRTQTEVGECVHHKDFDKSNNNLSNLAICTQREHRIFQLQLEEIAIRLYKKGLVKFDDAKLEYRLLEGIL